MPESRSNGSMIRHVQPVFRNFESLFKSWQARTKTLPVVERLQKDVLECTRNPKPGKRQSRILICQSDHLLRTSSSWRPSGL
ncbi:uncharacterized protein [Physcomitrium patens]|uniref:Uncharacterized protein n=1 Tax=Physcomitrium patens TaxID=3218 RepID=A0A7I4DDP8_PHYPA